MQACKQLYHYQSDLLDFGNSLDFGVWTQQGQLVLSNYLFDKT